MAHDTVRIGTSDYQPVLVKPPAGIDMSSVTIEYCTNTVDAVPAAPTWSAATVPAGTTWDDDAFSTVLVTITPTAVGDLWVFLRFSAGGRHSIVGVGFITVKA